MKKKLIYDLRFFIWVLIAMAAVFAALVCDTFFVFAVYSVVAVMSVFGIDVVTRGVGCAVVNAVILIVAYLAGGINGVIASSLLFLIPAFGMSEIIKYYKDFYITFAGGLGLISLGIMVIDRVLVQPVTGGLRLIFSSAIDSIAESAVVMSEMFATTIGIASSEAEAVITMSCSAMKLLFPGFVVSVSIFVLLFALLGSKRIIAGIPVPAFFELRGTSIFAYAYCIGQLVAGFLSDTTGIILSNVVVILSVVLFICGISLLRYFTRLIPSRVLSVIVFVIALPVCCSFPYIMTTVGMADSVFDFRRFRNVKK